MLREMLGQYCDPEQQGTPLIVTEQSSGIKLAGSVSGSVFLLLSTDLSCNRDKKH